MEKYEERYCWEYGRTVIYDHKRHLFFKDINDANADWDARALLRCRGCGTVLTFQNTCSNRLPYLPDYA